MKLFSGKSTYYSNKKVKNLKKTFDLFGHFGIKTVLIGASLKSSIKEKVI